MPEPVETTDPEGVDYTWVMQVTFLVTLAAGVPLVAALSLFAELTTWADKAAFAARVGALVWFATAVGVYAYARREQV